MPGDHSIHLTLSVSTASDDRSTLLHLGVTVEPLLAQHSDESGKEGGSQTRIENGLDMDNGGIGTIPLRKSGIGTSRDVPKSSTGDNLKKSMVHFLVVRFELALYVDDESACDSGEQTGLLPRKCAINTATVVSVERTHEDQGGIHVFIILFDKVAVMIVGCALELVVELDAGVAGCSGKV